MNRGVFAGHLGKFNCSSVGWWKRGHIRRIHARHMRRRMEDTCTSCAEADTSMSYEDTCMAYEEEDTCLEAAA